MDHCKDKKKHKWKPQYGMMTMCEVCGKVKRFNQTPSGRKNAKGAFGKC